MTVVWGECPWCSKRLCAKESGVWVQLPCPKCKTTVVVCDAIPNGGRLTTIPR